MKVDASLTGPLSSAASKAAGLEAAGYSGAWTAETSHDPFLPLAVAAANTNEIELGTSIAVAFARNPMLLANIGWDLQSLSKGRFLLSERSRAARPRYPGRTACSAARRTAGRLRSCGSGSP
jgi:alkanesulfonate monooxygenase SsuD/methylene tetrahydromethanopterin reductase-like flavin-dependent oxidoreductase (luciferase family)